MRRRHSSTNALNFKSRLSSKSSSHTLFPPPAMCLPYSPLRSYLNIYLRYSFRHSCELHRLYLLYVCALFTSFPIAPLVYTLFYHILICPKYFPAKSNIIFFYLSLRYLLYINSKRIQSKYVMILLSNLYTYLKLSFILIPNLPLTSFFFSYIYFSIYLQLIFYI